MDNTYKVAVASTDGIVVNQHFGRTERFLIYEIEKNNVHNTGEIRCVSPVCSCGNHDDSMLENNLRQIQDCRYLLVSKIGMGASAKAEQLGITPMELPDMIEESIRKVISFEQIQNLFERN